MIDLYLQCSYFAGILTEEHLQSLSIDVTNVTTGVFGNVGSGSRIGDSGYMSQSGVPNRLLPHNYTEFLTSPSCIEEARLVPHTIAGMHHNFKDN